jgi:diguanylate cyclase (GGDEF)-like protein
MFGAGFVTIMNAAAPLHGVNTIALRITGVLTILASVVVTRLPWERHARVVSYGVVVAAIAALTASDSWHHYSRNDAAIAVYPIFFIVVIAWAGLTQTRGTPTVVAGFSGFALAWLLHDTHSAAAVQCVVVTVPVAAILGEVVSWSHRRALALGDLDTRRRVALEALVEGASRLQEALTTEEREQTLIETANKIFAGSDTRFRHAPSVIDDGPSPRDTQYDSATRQLRISLRGQVGVVGTLTTQIDQPDAFMLDAARLYSQHLGSRYEQLRVLDALTDAATLDPLTGVGNRRAAQSHLESLEPGDTVFMLDLDNFKRINDSLGHQTGDRLLQQFADYLRATTRATDTVARYGGEEFLLICRHTRSNDAERIANHLLHEWRNQRPLTTFSIGWAIHQHDTVTQQTIELADMALYDAKRSGRDCARPSTQANTHTTANANDS